METPQADLGKSPKTRSRLLSYILGILMLVGLLLIPISVSYAQEAGKLGLVQGSSGGIGDSSLKQSYLLTDPATATPTITKTATLTPTSSSIPTKTPTPTESATPSPAVMATQPRDTKTPSPTITGTITPFPSIKVVVIPAQAKVNESFTFTIEAGNKGYAISQNNFVFDSFPTFIDVQTVTTSRGTITKETHSFLVTIGDIVPNEKITIIAVVKVNSTLTRTEIISNIVTLLYDFSKSITASVNYTAVYEPPPTETPTPSPTSTATETGTATKTATSTASPTVTGTQPTNTSTPSTPSPTITGTITPVPSIKVVVTPTSAKVNESFTFTIEAGNKGYTSTQNNIVFDSFPTYIDVSTVTTSRGTITKLTHSFVVTIGDMVPNEKVTIIATVKVNSSLTKNEVTSNLVTLAYDYSKSITASVNYTAVYQALPHTGELPLNWRDTRLKPVALIPGIMLLGLGVGLLVIGIWLKVSNKRDSYAMIAIGSLFVIIGFVAGIYASGVLLTNQQANGRITAPTSSGILAQIYPVEITETGLPRLPASAFSTPEALVPVVTLPDYPIPTPEITVTPQPGEAESDISPVVRIVIPGISLDTEVKYVPYDGYTWLINGLRQEVAWMGNTSWPGLGGNTALAGHVTVTGLGDGPFRHLDELLAGEVVILYTEKNMYTYNVRERRVTDDGDMSVTLASDYPQITLITCTDWDQESQTYLKRLVVFADLIRTEPITRGSVP